jgi:hypothetical protein
MNTDRMMAIVVTGLLGLPAAAAAGPSAPDPLAAISAYAGTWRAEVDQLDSEFSKAGKSANLIHNDCWRTTLFHACAQTVNGKQVALMVYTWDEKTGAYATRAITPDGASGGAGKLVIEGDTWYFPWDQEKDGAKIHFRVVNHFVGRDTIQYRQEFSRDGAHWMAAETGIERRVGR